MARSKLVHAALPLPARTILKGVAYKGAHLLEVLRGIALKNQKTEPQVFYRPCAPGFVVRADEKLTAFVESCDARWGKLLDLRYGFQQ